jgi:hypothetical protein
MLLRKLQYFHTILTFLILALLFLFTFGFLGAQKEAKILHSYISQQLVAQETKATNLEDIYKALLTNPNAVQELSKIEPYTLRNLVSHVTVLSKFKSSSKEYSIEITQKLPNSTANILKDQLSQILLYVPENAGFIKSFIIKQNILSESLQEERAVFIERIDALKTIPLSQWSKFDSKLSADLTDHWLRSTGQRKDFSPLFVLFSTL